MKGFDLNSSVLSVSLWFNHTLFGMERSLVPAEEATRLASVFTEPVAPLRHAHLGGERLAKADGGGGQAGLIPRDRTLHDYARAGIDLRLTRANYRTGRLEVSAYLSTEGFCRYLQKQAWRLEKEDPDKIPLGSFRLQVPGNPNAINAALASGRFPGVLAPYPLEALYPPEDPENRLLHRLLTHWLGDPEVASGMAQAAEALVEEEAGNGERWQKTYDRWRASESMRDFFPRAGDVYVDGGAIDNPTDSLIE